MLCSNHALRRPKLPIILLITIYAVYNYTVLRCQSPLTCTYTVLRCRSALTCTYTVLRCQSQLTCTYTVLRCQSPLTCTYTVLRRQSSLTCTYTVLLCQSPLTYMYVYCIAQTVAINIHVRSLYCADSRHFFSTIQVIHRFVRELLNIKIKSWHDEKSKYNFNRRWCPIPNVDQSLASIQYFQ